MTKLGRMLASALEDYVLWCKRLPIWMVNGWVIPVERCEKAAAFFVPRSKFLVLFL